MHHLKHTWALAMGRGMGRSTHVQLKIGGIKKVRVKAPGRRCGCPGPACCQSCSSWPWLPPSPRTVWSRTHGDSLHCSVRVSRPCRGHVARWSAGRCAEGSEEFTLSYTSSCTKVRDACKRTIHTCVTICLQHRVTTALQRQADAVTAVRETYLHARTAVQAWPALKKMACAVSSTCKQQRQLLR